MEEKQLPSGASLKISLAPFADAKNFYQVFLSELRTINLDPNRDIEHEMIRELFLLGFSSKKLDAALAPCMARALYSGSRIVDDTFEPEKAREDYLHVCWEVAYANLRPFMKNLRSLLKSAISRVAAPPQAPATA